MSDTRVESSIKTFVAANQKALCTELNEITLYDPTMKNDRKKEKRQMEELL